MSLKNKALLIFSLLVSITSFSQRNYKINSDSVLISNDTSNAELNLENSTRNVNGFLYNKGNGRTEFRKAVIKINDSLYLIGGDTVNLHGSSLNKFSGLTRSNDSLMWGGDLFQYTRVNMKGNTIRFNFSDSDYTKTPGDNNITIASLKDAITDVNPLYLQTFHTGNSLNSYAGPGGFYAETWWNSPTPVTSGWYPNFVSRHKSTNLTADYRGTFLSGFSSYMEIHTTQKFGTFAHFYATPVYSSGGNVDVMYGLLVSTLKDTGIHKSYAIYTAGVKDSIFNAGPVKWPSYLNNAGMDSVLTTDTLGNVKLRSIGSLGSSPFQSVKDSTIISWDVKKNTSATVTLSGNRTLSILNAANGDHGKIIIKQDSLGYRKLTLPPNSYLENGGGENLLTLVGKSIDVLSFDYDGSNYYWTVHRNYAPRTVYCKFNFSQYSQYIGGGWTNVWGDPTTSPVYSDTASGWVLTTNGSQWGKYAGWAYGSNGDGGSSSPSAVYTTDFPQNAMMGSWINDSKALDSTIYPFTLSNLDSGTYQIKLIGSIKSSVNPANPDIGYYGVSFGSGPNQEQSLHQVDNTQTILTWTGTITNGQTIKFGPYQKSPFNPSFSIIDAVIIAKIR